MTEHPPALPAAEAIAMRSAERRRRRLGLLGAALIAYGLVGIVILVAIGSAIGRPLDRVSALSREVEDQRQAAIESLTQATITLEQTASGVRGMEPSLGQAKAATDRSSSISRGVAASMFELSRAMSISIFGTQPLIGLATGFDQTGQQLQSLADDIMAIGDALDENRDDVQAVAASFEELRDAVEELETSLREGQQVAISPAALAGIRLASLALLGWLALLALGCLAAGGYLVAVSRR